MCSGSGGALGSKGLTARLSAAALTWSKPKAAPGIAMDHSLAARAGADGQSAAVGNRDPTPTLARKVRRSRYRIDTFASFIGAWLPGRNSSEELRLGKEWVVTCRTRW